MFRRRDSPPFAGFTELAAGRCRSVVPWEEFGSPRRSTRGSLNGPSSLHQQHGPAARNAASTYQSAEAIPSAHASLTPPGETISAESHDWTARRQSGTSLGPAPVKANRTMLLSICTAAPVTSIPTSVSTYPLSLLDLRSADLCSTNRPLGDHSRHSRAFPRTTQLTAPIR